MRSNTLQGGDTRVKSTSDSDEQKGRQFLGKNRGDRDTVKLTDGDD